MAHYYKAKNPFYKEPPSLRTDCNELESEPMEFIYPNGNDHIFLPKNFNGNTNELILKIAHNSSEAEVFWYVDQQFLGITKQWHEMAVIPNPGVHKITAIDTNGHEITCKITITE